MRWLVLFSVMLIVKEEFDYNILRLLWMFEKLSSLVMGSGIIFCFVGMFNYKEKVLVVIVR